MWNEIFNLSHVSDKIINHHGMFERMFNVSKNITSLIHLGVKMPKYDFQHKMHVPVKIE